MRAGEGAENEKCEVRMKVDARSRLPGSCCVWRKEGRKDAGGSVETVAHNVWLVCGEGVGSPE